MEIIKRGTILPQEEVVANKIRQLPNNWWCIAGDSNRFTFKKGYGSQIDFLIISPKGVFLIDSKNVSTIELSEGNLVSFYNSSGKQIRKKRENPVEEVIENKYNAKDWLRNKGIKDLLTPDNKDLKVYIHGLVVISNDNVKYKNCSLKQLNYYSHKYKTLIPIEELNKDFFESIDLPPNCKKLTKEEMWTLYKIFYNPDMNFSQILTEVKREADSLVQEKYVFFEKVRILENENLNLNKKVDELEGTRNNLITMNQDLNDKTNLLDNQVKSLSKEIALSKELNKILKEGNTKYENIENDLKITTDKANTLRAKIIILESENKKLIKKTEKQKQHNQLTIFKITSVILASLLSIWVIYFFVKVPTNNGIIEVYGSRKIFYRLEKYYPSIRKLYENKNYNKAIQFWQNNVLAGKDFKSQDMHGYDNIFFYLAVSYQKKGSLDNAIKYYDIFTELSQNRNHKKLLEAYLNRVDIHKKKKDIPRAIGALQDAKEIVKNIFKNSNEKPLWDIRIYNSLAGVYRLVGSLRLAEQKDLGIKNPYELAMTNYYNAIRIASRVKNYIVESKVLLEIANMFLKDKKDYRRAIKKFDAIITFLKKNKNNFDKADKNSIDRIRMTVYHGLGVAFANINNNINAEQNYLTAIEISENYKDKIYEATFRLNLANLYKHLKKYSKAQYQIEKAYSIAQKLYKQKKLSQPYFDRYADTLDQLTKLYKINNK